MSWLVQNLLRDSIKIHSEGDVESDSYNDLLIIETKIKELREKNILSSFELSIIEYVADGKPLTKSKKHLGKHRLSISKAFRSVCNKVSFYLGGYFTDEGYIEYMKDKYKLSEEQVEKMLYYINNKYKYKIMRKPINVKKTEN